MLDFIKNISALLSYYVPGYLARTIYLRLTRVNQGEKIEGISETNEMVSCIVISYLTTTIVQVCVPKCSVVVISFLSILLSILSSIGFSFLLQSDCFKRLFIKVTRTTPQSCIWETILPKNQGKIIRGYIEFNHKKARIEGKVKYYEVDKDGECRIALADYRVISEDINYEAEEGAIYMISTKNTHSIEIFNS